MWGSAGRGRENAKTETEGGGEKKQEEGVRSQQVKEKVGEEGDCRS